LPPETVRGEKKRWCLYPRETGAGKGRKKRQIVLSSKLVFAENGEKKGKKRVFESLPRLKLTKRERGRA